MSDMPVDPDAAERIASAVRTLRREAPTVNTDKDPFAGGTVDATVVDIDAISRAYVGTKLDLEDLVLRPVWNNVLFGYRRQWADRSGWYTNLTHVLFIESDGAIPGHWTAVFSYFTITDQDPGIARIFDGRVAIALDTDGRAVAIAERAKDGGPLTLDDHGYGEFRTRLFAPLFCLNLMNCRNVVVVNDPPRPRPAARRIARTGVTVSEIHILPTGTTRTGRGEVRTIPVGSTPLHSVRGHPAEYGPAYGKGLLFGRIEGRFWIPQHARGNPDVGVVEQTYEIEP